MDGHQARGMDQISRLAFGGARPADEKRSFLFLQGPISTFFDRLGRALIARGHGVHHIDLHFGDQLFWRLPAAHYRGRFEDWRAFVGEFLDRHQITDVVLHGDRRPYHIVAAEEARARGIAVIATDLGYVRPDWITLEYDGMTTYSRFPRDPAAIRALAAALPEAGLEPRFHTPFWLIAVLDVLYNLAMVFGRACYPHYRYHSLWHPFVEYAGWIWSRPKKLFAAPAAREAKRRLQTSPGSYFLVPLQISTDFQIRAHSPFGDVREAVTAIIASFAASGSRRRLVFVVHPLDNGLIGWHRIVARLARQHGVAGKVDLLPGGTPVELLCQAAGVVTINSTVGVTALHHGVPVKALGNAIFNIPGLTCQSSLDAFWHEPPAPDRELMAAFLRALVGTTQVKGGYYQRASQDCAIAGFIERLERGLYPLPPLAAPEFAARPPRPAGRSIVVAGVADAIGVALARALAAPGVRLCLVGGAAAALERASEDCRHRGALVDRVELGDGGEAALAGCAAAIDRGPPAELIVVLGGVKSDAAAMLVETMRRRGRGRIVLVGKPIERTAPGDPIAVLRGTTTLLADGTALRRRLRRDGISVAIVAPCALALRAAARLGEPSLAVVGADRLAAAVRRGLDRRRDVIAVPGAATAALRTVRLILMRLGAAARSLLLPDVGAIGEAADKAPLPGESGPGD